MNRSLTLMLFVLCTPEGFGQSSNSSTIQMPGIAQIHADFIGARKRVSGSTKSIPPHYFYKIEGYDYIMTIELSLVEPSTGIDTSIAIACIFPNNSIRIVKINPDSVLKRSPQYFEYSFPLEIIDNGNYNFVLSTTHEIERSIDPKFYQLLSDKQSIYLETPAD